MTYTLELDASQVNTLTLRATVGGTGGSGEEVFWSATKGPGGLPGTVIQETPARAVIDSNNTAIYTLRFSNVTATSKFIITAQLADSGGNPIPTASNAVVTITFFDPVPLTGVTLKDQDSPLIVREGAVDQSLTAVPTPSNATDVTYHFSSDNGEVVTVNQPSPTDATTGLAFAKPGTARITVTATGHDRRTQFTASRDVTVVPEGQIGDDMVMEPDETASNPTADEKETTILYGVDEAYTETALSDLNSNDIRIASGIQSGRVAYLVGKNKQDARFYVDRTRITSATGLNIEDYDTRVASAMRFDAEFTPNTERGNMIPAMLSFNLANRYYPDGRTPIENPTTRAKFHEKYRIMKYFDRTPTGHAIDISGILSASAAMGTSYMVHDPDTGEYRLGPLVVMVDALAPLDNWCNAYTGSNNEYGVKYDSTKNILFIYDGNPDGKIADPIVLEKRPSSPPPTGGGGGGGCSAGAGVLALIALAGLAAARKFRG